MRSFSNRRFSFQTMDCFENFFYSHPAQVVYNDEWSSFFDDIPPDFRYIYSKRFYGQDEGLPAIFSDEPKSFDGKQGPSPPPSPSPSLKSFGGKPPPPPPTEVAYPGEHPSSLFSDTWTVLNSSPAPPCAGGEESKTNPQKEGRTKRALKNFKRRKAKKAGGGRREGVLGSNEQSDAAASEANEQNTVQIIEFLKPAEGVMKNGCGENGECQEKVKKSGGGRRDSTEGEMEQSDAAANEQKTADVSGCGSGCGAFGRAPF